MMNTLVAIGFGFMLAREVAREKENIKQKQKLNLRELARKVSDCKNVVKMSDIMTDDDIVMEIVPEEDVPPEIRFRVEEIPEPDIKSAKDLL